MGNQYNKYSFKDFCNDTNNKQLLDLWDDELNEFNPDSIGYSSIKKIWFKCPRGIHESREINLGSVTKAYANNKTFCICKKCNSIGQNIIDTYGEDYLADIWSDKNIKSPFDISKSSKDIIWLKCINNNDHPDYCLSTNNFQKTHTCPYCIGKKVCLSDSFGSIHPEYIPLWSDLNDKSIFDYACCSHSYAWFKCENGIHEDYKKKLYNQIYSVYKCPKCATITRITNMPRGKDSPYWKGDSVDENRRIRSSNEYNEWRKRVYDKDNYTCQCCGIYGGKLNAHHIKDFANHEDDRFDIINGIALCVDCHDTNNTGSFHNIYGTHGKTPEQLEEYINSKRKELGINIPFSLESYYSGNILKPGDIKQNPPWIFDLYPINFIKQENNFKRIMI